MIDKKQNWEKRDLGYALNINKKKQKIYNN